MRRYPDTTFAVLASVPVSEDVVLALASAATALGHDQAPVFLDVDECGADLALIIHEVDPWSVVAIDARAIDELGAAFGSDALELAPDQPVTVRGYTLVAVPGFADCLNDLPAKRVAWERLKAARHP